MKHEHTHPSEKIPVWDPFVRLFHWALVGAVSMSALTGYLLGASWLTIHILSGTVAAVLILARLIWGLVGSGYARFSGFVKGPRAVLEHIRELRAGTAPRHIGHNPAGAVMILALVGSVLALALSGLSQLGGEFKAGPLADFFNYATARAIAELHESLALFLMLLIGLHVAGAIFESLRTRENLPLSMITGVKESRPGDHRLAQKIERGALPLTLMLTAVALAVWGGSALTARTTTTPVHTINPTYAGECSACHMAYPPSLLPAQNWQGLMATLSDHFGEDASLGDKTTAELTRWLAENAAETADTKPAHVLAQTDPKAPFTISETPFWRDTHDAIDEATFRRAPIFSKANCAACHSDAESGRFFPGNIKIPKESTQ